MEDKDENANDHIPFDLSIQFSPNNPVQFDATSPGYGQSTTEKGIQQPKPSFLDTAVAQGYDFNATAELIHYKYDKFQQPNPYDDIPTEGWNPQTQPEMFYDLQPQYQPYLMAARGPKDLAYRRERALAEQDHEEKLANGSTFARIIGAVGGVLTDPISYIPIANAVKYTKMSPTILKTMQKSLPGVASVGIYQSGAKQLDKVNGNLHDFVIDSFINTVFGSAIFGGLRGLSLAADKMELWNLRNLAKESIKGVDFKFELGAKNEIKGVKAFSTDKNLSAAEVDKAQEIANSAFLKGGIFKIPFLGEGILKLKGAPVIGSPLIAMANSTYEIERAFIDRAADHSFWRKGIEQKEASPKSFEHFMKKEFADLRSISAQLNALHLERMGYDITPKSVGDMRYAAQATYSRSLKLIAQDSEKYGWISREQFDDEVQKALFSGETSQHAAVNQAYGIIRPKLDNLVKAFNDAYGKQTILTPKMAAEYLMRVYDINYLNGAKNEFVDVISGYFKEADEFISQRLEPINELQVQIKEFEKAHTEAIAELGKKATPNQVPTGTELVPTSNVIASEMKTYQVKPQAQLPGGPKALPRGGGLSEDASITLAKMKLKLKSMQEDLQNELRSNEDLKYHVHDAYALSANEANELTKIMQPINNLKAKAEEQKAVISELRSQKSRKLATAKRKETKEKAQPHAEEYVEFEKQIAQEEEKLHEINRNIQDEEYNLYSKQLNGEVNPALYYPETLKFKDPNNRLRFRDVYESHIHRENYAKAAYDSIMHTNAEDTVADIMGKVTGNGKENPLKARTLLVPDSVLYKNNFMTKNLMSKVNNYALYISRRTHIKNVFKDVTHEGGIEPILEKLNQSYKSKREPFDLRKAKIKEELELLDKDTDKELIKKLNKENKGLTKNITNETKRFNRSKERMQMAYERMMGLRKREKWEVVTQGVIRSLVAMVNLHQLPLTQIADLGTIGLQHGAWPFVRDTVYPVLTSVNGLLKTKDSEAIREAAPHLHLGFQDTLNGHADKNISLETQPYINMGPWVGGVEKLAHFSGNADLTNYIDNWLQRWTAATVQSKFMEILHKFANGTVKPRDHEYLLKYGIDPKVWGERMVKAYEDSQGFKTKLGGYQSKFWQWQDLEAANEFSSGVFRAVQNTVVQRGMFDSPYWADNLMGMVFHTFTGWGYASLNRYLIPILQRPDSEQLLGVMLSLTFGSMVSPLRRIARGEEAYPDQMTDGQKFYEVIADSSVTSAMANTLSWANLLSGDRLIGDLKNDKYRNRLGIGASSVVFGTANKLYAILASLASGEVNEKDTRTAAYMLPVAGSLYGRQISDIIIDKLGLPPNRRAAQEE